MLGSPGQISVVCDLYGEIIRAYIAVSLHQHFRIFYSLASLFKRRVRESFGASLNPSTVNSLVRIKDKFFELRCIYIMLR